MEERGNPITHPSHYVEGRQYEPRKVIVDWDLDFYLGNVIKYISRAGRKGDKLEDLYKAMQYLQWEIELEEEFKLTEEVNEVTDKYKKDPEGTVNDILNTIRKEEENGKLDNDN